MPTNQHIAQLYVEWTDGGIDGGYQPLEKKYMDNLISVEVDDSLYLPDMFSVKILDPGIAALKADAFKLGRKIKISVKLENQSSRVELMRGEITAVEPDINSVERATLVCRGYDLSHKLNRSRKTTTFQNMTDADVVRKLAQGASLQAQTSSTSIVYPFLMQTNQTDWEFMQERAKRIGHRLYVEGQKVYFKPLSDSPPKEVDLEWGLTLNRFQGRVSTIDQPSQVQVLGWDPKAKQKIVGQATSPTGSVQLRKDQGSAGGAVVQTAHSVQSKMTITDQPVFSQAEATKIAQATLDRMSSSFVQAEGRAGGNPDIRAGNAVNLKGLGPRFSGKYLVTRALHKYTADEYSTTFWVSGGSGSMTITDILLTGSSNSPSSNGGRAGGGGASAVAQGVMVGIVTNNKDPDNLGRVRVKFPALDDTEGFWCRLASTMAGSLRGIAYFPEANDEVVVAFQHGDPNHGYVLGAVWNGSDKTPKPLGQLVNGSQTIRRVIRSRVGHEIVIDDTPDPGGITIIDKTTMNKIVINTKENKIFVEAQSDVSVKSTTGKVSVEALSDVSLQSNTGNVQIKAAAGKVTVEGMAGVDVTSPAITSIKGSMVNINS